MRKALFVRAALIGLAGSFCTGCLDAGPLGIFDNGVYGRSALRADVVDHGRVVYVGSRSDRVDQ